MQYRDMSGGRGQSPPRRVERKLLVLRIEEEREEMRAINTPGDGSAILGIVSHENGPVADYDDWALVSHTFQVLPEGAGVVSLLFERPL